MTATRRGPRAIFVLACATILVMCYQVRSCDLIKSRLFFSALNTASLLCFLARRSLPLPHTFFCANPSPVPLLIPPLLLFTIRKFTGVANQVAPGNQESTVANEVSSSSAALQDLKTQLRASQQLAGISFLPSFLPFFLPFPPSFSSSFLCLSFLPSFLSFLPSMVCSSHARTVLLNSLSPSIYIYMYLYSTHIFFYT